MAEEPEASRRKWVSPVLLLASVSAVGVAVWAGLVSINSRTATLPPPASPPFAEQAERPPAQSSPTPTPIPPLQREARSVMPPPTIYAMPALENVEAGQFTLRDAAIKLTLTLPESPDGRPVLETLLKEAEQSFDHPYQYAHAILDATKDDPGPRPQLPYNHEIRWEYTAQSDDWVSLRGVESDWAGQSHPDWNQRTVIARRDGVQVDPKDFFEAAPDLPLALAIAVCEAVKAEKIRKTGKAELYDEPIKCEGSEPSVSVGALALAPSDQVGKFGGLQVYYVPYSVGSYAEGFYGVTVQQEVFAGDLKPEYRELFGGVAPALPSVN